MNNKIIKVLIPIIAVVIIFESVMLVSNLEKNTKSSVATKIVPTASKTVTTQEAKVLDLSFLTETKDMKVGKKYTISVNLSPINNFNLNALDLYVKFDPTMVTISNLISGKELPKPDFIKISDKKNVLALNYLFTVKEGMVLIKDKETTLLTFTVTPKKLGSSYFEISTGDSEGDSVTMFIDKVTSKGLPFSSNKLEISLIN